MESRRRIDRHVLQETLLRFLPTVRIELGLATELSRDREHKYAPVLDWIAREGCDLDLLKRAMDARQVPIEFQHSVLSRLRRIGHPQRELGRAFMAQTRSGLFP
jgi:hypothetical protein